jgi:hypothetical protein
VPEGQFFFGADQDAEGTTRGELNGTLVLDLCDWESHALATMVLGIIAEEVVILVCIYWISFGWLG